MPDLKEKHLKLVKDHNAMLRRTCTEIWNAFSPHIEDGWYIAVEIEKNGDMKVFFRER